MTAGGRGQVNLVTGGKDHDDSLLDPYINSCGGRGQVNLNTPESLSATTRRILEHLRHLPAAPGVTIGGGAESAPRDAMVDLDAADEDRDDPDERDGLRARDARVRPANDYGPVHGDVMHRDVQAAAEAPAGWLQAGLVGRTSKGRFAGGRVGDTDLEKL